MDQTPAHANHNPDLLNLISADRRRIIEIGCSSGALAREIKKKIPSCHYTGCDIDPDYVELAKEHCDKALTLNIDAAPSSFFTAHGDCDTWIFGDTLEHLADPWKVLREIKNVLPAHGCVAVCIPNAQHWSVQARLSTGDFRYESSGLLDRTHLRWFTRKTLFELFADSGFSIEKIQARDFNEDGREDYIQLIGDLAEAAGADPVQAMADARPLQYVILARPSIT